MPALTLPLAEALPLLVRARRDPAAHPATACWGAAALHALRLVARGRLLPGLTPAGHDAWRAGPLEPDDIAHLRAVAAAPAPEGHAVPLPGSGPLCLPEPEALVRSLPWTPSPTPCPARPRPPTPPAGLRRPRSPAPPRGPRLGGPRSPPPGWTRASGSRSRLDLSASDVFDAGEREGTRAAGAAIVQVHSLADPTLVTDAAALWAGEADTAFGPRARVDAALAVRRAARV